MLITLVKSTSIQLVGVSVVSWAGNLDTHIGVCVNSVSLLADSSDTTIAGKSPSLLAILLDA